MIGLILCAGKGKRLKPLSDVLPKPLLPISGKPVIFWTIQAMIALEFERIGLVVQNRTKPIFVRFLEQYFGSEEFDIFVQHDLSGIITAIETAERYFNREVVICAGDTVFKSDHLNQFIPTTKADLQIGIQQRSTSEIMRRSNIIINEKYEVLATVEKPHFEEIRSNWSGVPIWKFTPDVWRFVNHVQPTRTNERIIQGLIEVLHTNGKQVSAVELEGTQDLTFPKDLLYHNFDYIRELRDD